jgi:hypothetical protein
MNCGYNAVDKLLHEITREFIMNTSSTGSSWYLAEILAKRFKKKS